MKAQQLTPRMAEALLAAATGHNASNMHGTYKALRTRGLVEYVWGRAEGCWVITPEGETLAAEISDAK
jgi:hypothetical protein